MKTKLIATGLLLGFVALSLGAIVVKEFTRPVPPAVIKGSEAGTAIASPDIEVPEERAQFVAYYFFGNVRCTTCKAIESQSHSAIATAFAGRLEAGEMEWRLVNFDLPENEHFRKDFELAFQSLVLVEQSDGAVVRWKNLTDVWSEIHESPEDFETYVVESVTDFLSGEDPS